MHRLKRDRVMEMPPKSAMVEANLKAKWPVCRSQPTSDLQLHPVEPVGSQSPCSTSMPPLSHAPRRSCPLLSPVPLSPSTLSSPCQVGEGQSCPTSATWLSSVTCLASAVLGNRNSYRASSQTGKPQSWKQRPVGSERGGFPCSQGDSKVP